MSMSVYASDSEEGDEAVISSKCNSVKDNADMNWGLYRYWQLVENAFARQKQY